MESRVNFRLWLEGIERQAILVATGAYNPVHRGHIQVFYHARRFLASKNIFVVGAYMVPRNYPYVQKKSLEKGELPVEDRHRQELVHIATHGTFIKVLPLEAVKGKMSWPQIRSEVQTMHPDKEIILVAGDDKGGCDPEPGSDMCLADIAEFGGPTVIVGRSLAGAASSTAVRRSLRQGQESPYLAPAGRRYIHQHGLWAPEKPGQVA